MTRSWRRNVPLGLLSAGLLLFLAGCAGGIRSIDLTYVPTSQPEKVTGSIAELTYGVTSFVDARSQKEFVASIPWPSGNVEYKPTKPLGDVVADAIVERLREAGLKANRLPDAWDLKADGLKSNWPDVVIGGRIDRFWATTNTNDTVHKVKANINLHIVIGTPHGDRILYEKSIIGTVDDTRVLGYEKWVTSALKDTYSAAIDQFFRHQLLLTTLESVHR